MAEEAKTQLFAIKIGNANYIWRAPRDTYKGIEKAFGVVAVTDIQTNSWQGASTKPPHVRVNLSNGRSVLRFCHPDKMAGLIFDGKANRLKLDGYNINSVRAIRR